MIAEWRQGAEESRWLLVLAPKCFLAPISVPVVEPSFPERVESMTLAEKEKAYSPSTCEAVTVPLRAAVLSAGAFWFLNRSA